jgi:hypothetical protein
MTTTQWNLTKKELFQIQDLAKGYFISNSYEKSGFEGCLMPLSYLHGLESVLNSRQSESLKPDKMQMEFKFT